MRVSFLSLRLKHLNQVQKAFCLTVINFSKLGKTNNGDDMKDFFKTINLAFLGLVVAIVIYPMIHELGHSLFALCTGSRVLEITFFPLPSVLCSVEKHNFIAVVLAGLGGLLLPFVITLTPPPKKFFGWYIWFIIKGISLLSFVISIVSLFLFQSGNPLENDDITQLMRYAPQYANSYYTIIVGLMFVTCIHIIKSNPIKRCKDYFDIQ